MRSPKNNDANNFSTLYNLADHMLYFAKNKGKNGKEYVLSYESVAGNDTRHLEDMYLYRLLDKIFIEALD